MKKAFTLIELLVVIAIIAVLAAILFPVFGRAKDAAKKTQSISNIKQIGLAWQLYNFDYDDTLMRMSVNNQNGTIYWWGLWNPSIEFFDPKQGLIYPYTKSSGIYRDSTFTTTVTSKMNFSGYGYNYFYLSPSNYLPPTWDEIPIPVNASSVEFPTETVAFASNARLNTWAYSKPIIEGTGYIEPPSANYPTFHGRHNTKGVVLWCDTHATTKKPSLRVGDFGWGYNGVQFAPYNLGEIDQDGNFNTDELFDLN